MHKILVVDDDKDLLEMVCIFLVQQGFKVECTSEVASLTGYMNAFQPDIILMDIYLGGADGRELCLELKQSSVYRHIPVILYSAGNISASSIDKSMADGFLVKPFSLGQLISKINAYITAA